MSCSKLLNRRTKKIGEVRRLFKLCNTTLKSKAIESICKDMGVKIPTLNRVEIPTLTTENTHSQKDKILTIPTEYLLEELKKKDIELENKNKQIDNLIEAQKQTQNLLDQQQRLALQDKKLLEEYKSENDSLKALKISTQDSQEEQVENQTQEVPNEAEEPRATSRKWWQFLK